VKAAAMHAASPDALVDAARSIPDAAYPLLLQERIVGDGIGVFLLIRGSETLAAFAHRRIREKPPSGGVGVYRESIEMDAELLGKSQALLAAFEWEGAAMVEYKREASTGTPYLMEINGRFWGSLQLAIDAGVDFPALLLSDKEDVTPPTYRVGMRSRWEWGEVDHLLARLRRSPRALALPPGAPGRLRAVGDFLAAALSPRTRGEVFRLADPLPFARETADWLRGR
jgi:predicted ATP-grasp superfamily ATP-dependent carboligase